MPVPNCFRIARALRSMCAPITTVIAFSCLLTWIFILYQPNPGPGLTQRVGWQSWEVVSVPPSSASTNVPSTSEPISDSPASEALDLSSLPLDVWSPLLPHDTGLSEITVVRCLLDPAKTGDLCRPDSNSEQDAIKGKWVRVERNLNIEAGYMSGWLNIYYRRTRRQDINLITDIQLLPDKEQPSPSEGWRKVSTSLRTGVLRAPPLFMWYRVGKTAADMSTEEKAQIITELDLLYGEDVPWYGFDKLEPPTMIPKRNTLPTWITFRRGVKCKSFYVPPRAPPLHFSRDGKFKILQVADLHYSVSQGYCRDTLLSPCDHSDNMTTTLLGRVLDAEKPDMVVFTGDQLNGQGTSWDPKSVLAKFAKAVHARKIPWAAVFGNHDEEDGLAKDTQVMLMKGLPYSLVDRGPKDIHGSGNYVLKVMSADPSKTHLLTLYFLDSGSYSKGFPEWFGFFTSTEYDWIRQDQIDWFLQESGSISQIERPFVPDTGKDMGKIWDKRQGSDQVVPQSKRLAKPNALMFFHIPLAESYSKADTDRRTDKPLDVGISGQEQRGNAKGNDGFFEKGILKAMESDHRAAGQAHEVKVIGNGHCHLTENCRRVQGVWHCFGGGGSYSGYGKIGFDRRFRVYDISDYGETIRTYKRTEKDEVVDEMILAGIGAAPL
ncbi:Metallo-dependent phosphatase-like protein [Cyathus striatus]|nr:Metallo-dependent phosphatase-like protein [Cyathus striatus]